MHLASSVNESLYYFTKERFPCSSFDHHGFGVFKTVSWACVLWRTSRPPKACCYSLIWGFGCHGAQKVENCFYSDLYGWSWFQPNCQVSIVRDFVLQHENKLVSTTLESWKVKPRKTFENYPANSLILKVSKAFIV